MPTDVIVPPVGTNVDTVVLAAWYKGEGDTVARDEPLFAVETDKATLDVESPASGTLRQVACPVGAEVSVLKRIAVIVAPDEVLAPANADETSPPVAPPAPVAGSATGIDAAAAPPPERIFISPRAKRLAVERGLEWRPLRGTGPEGAIVERDVRAALEASVSAPSEEEEVLETIPMVGVRAVLFERMARSAAETASVTLTTETDATALVELRARLKADGVAVSYNDLLLSILGHALREHPRLNASLVENVIKVWRRIHVGLAVETDRGLLAPVVRDVDRKRPGDLARETAALIAAAREGRIRPEDLRGGTFTLTNLGMYGVDAFTPVINLPETAILGVGRIKPQWEVREGQMVERQKVWLSLTFDHRLVDGGPAARFLQRVAQRIEKPHLLLA